MKRTHTQTLKARNAVAMIRTSIQHEFSKIQENHPRLFQLALNEAEALAWDTGFPHLVFPALAMEKVQAVCAWYKRQTRIRRMDPTLAFAA
jgi:hypothetical protein